LGESPVGGYFSQTGQQGCGSIVQHDEPVRKGHTPLGQFVGQPLADQFSYDIGGVHFLAESQQASIGIFKGFHGIGETETDAFGFLLAGKQGLDDIGDFRKETLGGNLAFRAGHVCLAGILFNCLAAFIEAYAGSPQVRATGIQRDYHTPPGSAGDGSDIGRQHGQAGRIAAEATLHFHHNILDQGKGIANGVMKTMVAGEICQSAGIKGHAHGVPPKGARECPSRKQEAHAPHHSYSRYCFVAIAFMA
jgi:hypothetical protein